MKKVILTLFLLSCAAGAAAIDSRGTMHVIKKNLGAVNACYAKRRAAGLKRRGKLKVAWQVDDTGTARNFQILVNQLNDKKLAQCVTGEIQSWKFPPTPHGQFLNISYPFYFKAQKGRL